MTDTNNPKVVWNRNTNYDSWANLNFVDISFQEGSDMVNLDNIRDKIKKI